MCNENCLLLHTILKIIIIIRKIHLNQCSVFAYGNRSNSEFHKNYTTPLTIFSITLLSAHQNRQQTRHEGGIDQHRRMSNNNNYPPCSINHTNHNVNMMGNNKFKTIMLIIIIIIIIQTFVQVKRISKNKVICQYAIQTTHSYPAKI